ncbi:MAG: DHH family phosphoesterase, partial [Candidatus Gracilibacteria bacterium]
MPLSQVQLDIISVIKKAKHILVLPSSPIDADSIGSALALYLALKKLDKTVTIVAEEKIPENYNFLPEVAVISHDLNFVRDLVVTIDCRDTPPGNVRHEIQGNKINIIVTPQKGSIEKEQVVISHGGVPYDCIVTVDAADPSQFKKVYDNFTELFHLVPVINIDHHTSNNSFGKINFVDIMAPSTTTLIMPLVEELGQNLMDADIATLLLAGLITDTGSFQNPNTTPDAFSIAAKLIGYGARQQEIIRHLYKTKKLSTLKLWGRTLSKIQYDEPHRLVWSVLTVK